MNPPPITIAAPESEVEPLFVDLQEEVEPVPDAGQIPAGQIEAVAPQGAARQHHGVMLGQQIGQRHVFADLHAAADFHAAAADLLDLAVDDVARQAEGRNALVQHAARPHVLFQHGDRMAAAGQFPRHRQARHAGADHRHALARRLVEQRGQGDGLAGEEIGGRAFAEADGQRLALRRPAVPAGRFAGPRTDAAQDGRKNVVLQIDLVGRIEVAAGDGRQVFGYPRMGRAGGLAGDDGLDPLHVAGRLARLAERRRDPLQARCGLAVTGRVRLGNRSCSDPANIVSDGSTAAMAGAWHPTLTMRAAAAAKSLSSLRAKAAVGQASTHSRAARCRAADKASSSGAVTRTSNPRPTKASPNGSPAFSATRRQFPQRMHLPGS